MNTLRIAFWSIYCVSSVVFACVLIPRMWVEIDPGSAVTVAMWLGMALAVAVEHILFLR